MFGRFEKSIFGLLAILFGLYFALDHYFPAIVYPELKKLRNDPSVLIKAVPRKGEVVPTSVYSAYLFNQSLFLGQDDFGKKSENSPGDPKKINWFVKGTDGKEHPSNAYFLGFIPFHTNKYWLPLLAVSLRVKYKRDDEIILGKDIWQTSLETYIKMRGDCEDHSILLADWMTGLGYDARVVVGTAHGEGHAWVVLYKDGKEYLLETTDKASRRRYPFVALHPEYVPAIMFNRDHFWMRITKQKGFRRVQSEEWIILSDFNETFF